MRLAIFAWGNPSRGDDAAGPWLAQRLRSRCSDEITLVEDFQLQVEHLLDCRGASLLLFVDARCDEPGEFRFEEVIAQRSLAHTSHALTPGELLGYYSRTFVGEAPAPAFQLTVPGQHFDLGEPMSETTLLCCQRALEFLCSIIARPQPQHWRTLIRPKATGSAC